MIFAFVDEATLAACALVCRPWKEPALDELWKHLDSLLPLFGLLFDVEALLLGGGEYPENLLMRGVDWLKFRSYAQRVRSIDIEPGSLSLFHVNMALLAVASIDHPFGSLFLPHVHRLELGLDFKLLDEEAAALFPSLQGLAPNLQELSITFTSPILVGDLEAPLSRWISSLQHLTKLWLPPYYQPKMIVTAAGELKELKVLKIMVKSAMVANEEGMQMEFAPNTFPMLRALAWNSSLPNAFQLLQPSPRVEALESLYLDCSGYDDHVTIPTFTRLIGHACPRLREVSLILLPDWWTRAESSVGPLDMEVLYGLAPCENLVTLQIGHPFPMTLNESDVHWIGRSWRNLERLVLCVDPDLDRPINPRMGASILALPLLAELLPNLTRLGLYFRESDVMRFSGDLHPQHQFKNLRTLQLIREGIRFSYTTKQNIPSPKIGSGGKAMNLRSTFAPAACAAEILCKSSDPTNGGDLAGFQGWVC
ncbi:hypothetical protein M407DRAFT_18648 [Tulasnella calospora MUT 4182]|uniref:F-box domain-containing protein n=1 Tax=Tulasnella calospora MUT 4182 TaxID=1051891 RepID=A0A0C3LEK9_9AGAM|nr:hypothetical protein M407DRAFT_18648 [Tulasnella calospora MUT 4182]